MALDFSKFGTLDEEAAALDFSSFGTPVDEDHPKKEGGLISDAARQVGSSFMSAVGGAERFVGRQFQEAARPITNVINKVAGTELEPANPLEPFAAAAERSGKALESDISTEGRQALKDTTPTGNIFTGENISFGKDPSARGVLMQASSLFGSMAPQFVAALATRGASLPEQMVAGGVTGGVTGAGNAMQQARETLDQMNDKKLYGESSVYRALVDGGMDARSARERVTREAENFASALTFPVSGLGGAATGAIIGKGAEKLVGGMGSRTARAATLGGVSAGEEAIQETGEGVATIAGQNIGAGTSTPLGEGSFGNATLGALGGTGPGGVRGAFTQGKSPVDAAADVMQSGTVEEAIAAATEALDAQSEAEMDASFTPLPSEAEMAVERRQATGEAMSQDIEGIGQAYLAEQDRAHSIDLSEAPELGSAPVAPLPPVAPGATPAAARIYDEAAPSGDIAYTPTDLSTASDAYLIAAAKLTRSDARRAEISAEIERRSVSSESQNQSIQGVAEKATNVAEIATPDQSLGSLSSQETPNAPAVEDAAAAPVEPGGVVGPDPSQVPAEAVQGATAPEGVDGAPVQAQTSQEGSVPAQEVQGAAPATVAGRLAMEPFSAKLRAIAPKGSYLGEFHSEGEVTRNLHKEGDKYRVLTVNNGQVSERSRLLDKSEVENFGGYNVSASQRVEKYRLKAAVQESASEVGVPQKVQPAQESAPFTEREQAPEGERFTDYTAPKANRAAGIIKGEVRVFTSERVAAVFAKRQGLDGYQPRKTDAGWVLSQEAPGDQTTSEVDQTPVDAGVSTSTPEESKGHVAWFAPSENSSQPRELLSKGGDLYIAPADDVLDVRTGNRAGRFYAPDTPTWRDKARADYPAKSEGDRVAPIDTSAERVAETAKSERPALDLQGETNAEILAKEASDRQNNDGQQWGGTNTIVTVDDVQEARDYLKKNIGRLNSGFDPVMAAKALKIATFHVEAGARTIATFTQRMVAEMGEAIRPHLDTLFEKATAAWRERGEITTAKDGSITVPGDPESIRARLPEGVVGRITKGGMVFTSSDAPRVRAALQGQKTAYGREGRVVKALPVKDGVYIGAPEKFNTPAKIPTLRRLLRQLADEGAPGRYWYENSSREILKMVGGDVNEARKFVALLAIYSPQAKVDANSTFALRAWAQYKAGQKISVKTGVMDRKAEGALADIDAFWSGEKTGNFFNNLLSEIDPATKGKQGATIDMWMMRAGQYSNDAPTATQYAFMENETNRLAQELGWEPQQVQAAIWVAMKARMENSGVKKRTEAKSERRGWLRYKEQDGKRVRVILDAQAHRDNWLEQAMQHDVTEDDTGAAKFDFSDGVRRHIGQVSWEPRPGRSTGILPGVHSAPYAQQVEFQQAVQKALYDAGGNDLLAMYLGLLEDGSSLGPGVWQSEVSAGAQALMAMAPAKGDTGKGAIDPDQKQLLDAYAAVLGLLLRQEAVGYHRPFYTTTRASQNGVELRIGRPFTPEEAKSLWAALNAKLPTNWEKGAGLISSPEGMRVVNFGAVADNKAFRALVEEAATELPEGLGVDPIYFASDGNLVENEWKENANGEGFKGTISGTGRPDLLGWSRDVLAPRVQAVFEDFSTRYGWGNPGDVTALFQEEVAPTETPADAGVSASERAVFRRGAPADGLSVEQVETIARSVTKGWKYAPKVEVIASMEEAPQAVREENEAQLAQGAEGVPYAFFHDGTVYLVQSEIKTVRQAVIGIFHEGLGHYGLRGVFGAALEKELAKIVVGRRAEVEAKAREYGLDMNVREERMIAAEEVLAELAQTRPELGLVQRFIASIRNWLREHGVVGEWSDSDVIEHFVLPARDFVERGYTKNGMSGTKFARKSAAYEEATTPQRRAIARLKDEAPGFEYEIRRPSESLNQAAESAFYNHAIEPGIKYVPIQSLGTLPGYDNAKDTARIRALADAIKESGEIEPIFVGIDPNGEAYIMEGQHRARAMKLLGERHIPARVVVSLDGEESDYAPEMRQRRPTDYKKAPGQSTLFARKSDNSEMTGESPSELADLWRRYENQDGSKGLPWMQERDLLNELEALEIETDTTLPESVKEAMQAYQDAIEEDFEMAGRGDADPYSEALVDAVRAAVRKPEVKAKFARKAAERPSRGWQMPDASKMDSAIYTLQDRHIDTKRALAAIRQAGKDIADKWDVYLKEEHYHGRTAKANEDFINKELKPLMADMAMRGVNMQEFEKYLHARHAEEANRVIAGRNEDMPDGGSGMDTADARAYLRGLSERDKRAYEALAPKVDKIIAGTRKMLVEYGLEAPDTIKAWEGQFKNYVPLMREDMDGAPGIGQGFSVRGPSSKERTGSKRAVVDILANIAMQRERAIVRGEKNRVAASLVGLATAAPNPEVWTVDRPKKIRALDDNGQVTEYTDPMHKSRPNVVVARIPNADGSIAEHTVTFNERDERAQRMVTALKNLDMDSLGIVLGNVAVATRYFASINTQYNPVFGVVNLGRDVQSAMANLSSTELAGQQARVLGHTLSALKGIYIDVRSERRGEEARSTWATEWEEFQKVGGKTGYRDMFADSKDRAKALEREIKRAQEGKLKAGGRAVFDWLSDYNTTMENAVRLAAYKVGKEEGMTPERAASLAKNLTVNFNRKGQIAMQAGALYAFFNASVQGSARLAETLKGPAGKKIIYGGMLLGVAQAALLAAAGFDDDEPPEFEREKNLIIPTGGKTYIKIPMGLGLHILPGIGRIATEFALGGFKKPGKHLGNLVGTLFDAFNPVGSGGGFTLASAAQMAAPTVADPLVSLATNKDWTGRPIAKEDRSNLEPTPGHTRAKDSATQLSKWISEGINAATGGTRFKPGAVSPTPDQIDYLIGQVTGGVGREISKAEQTVASMVTGEKLADNKRFFVSRFVGNADSPGSKSHRFYENVRELNEHQEEIKGRRREKLPVSDYLRENPESRLASQADAVERTIRGLTKRKRELIEKNAPREQIERFEKRIEDAMTRFNDRVRQAKKQQASQSRTEQTGP